MPVVMAGDRSFEVDEEGYLMESSNWDASFAAQVAEKEGFAPLIEDHWTVINFLRDYYDHLGKAPRVRDLIRGSGFSLKRINIRSLPFRPRRSGHQDGWSTEAMRLPVGR